MRSSGVLKPSSGPRVTVVVDNLVSRPAWCAFKTPPAWSILYDLFAQNGGEPDARGRRNKVGQVCVQPGKQGCGDGVFQESTFFPNRMQQLARPDFRNNKGVVWSSGEPFVVCSLTAKQQASLHGENTRASGDLEPDRNSVSLLPSKLVLDSRKDVGVTSIKDSQGSDSEKFTTRSTKLVVTTLEVVNSGLGQHSVVLQLRLSEDRGVTSDDDQLGLALSERLDNGLVSKGVFTRLDGQGQLGVHVV